MHYINERDMKRLNETEKDLIEAVRNFRASKGRMEMEAEYEWMIYFYLHKLMYDWQEEARKSLRKK